MTIMNTWAGAAAGEGDGVGLLAGLGPGLGVCAGAWATALGAQAARRQADMTRATNRILREPTIRPLNAAEKSFLGTRGPARARRTDHLPPAGRRGAARPGDRKPRAGSPWVCGGGGVGGTPGSMGAGAGERAGGRPDSGLVSLYEPGAGGAPRVLVRAPAVQIREGYGDRCTGWPGIFA